MEEALLGQARPVEPLVRILGTVLVLAALGTAVKLQAVGEALRESETSSRWASTLRDGVNLVSALALFLALLVCGLAGPAAFLVAGTTFVALDFLRHIGHDTKRGSRIAFFAALVIALPAALFAPQVQDALNRLAARLF